MREGIWGRTDQTKGHLKCCMENEYSRSFLEYIKKNKVIKTEWPNNRGHEAPTGNLLSPNEASSSRNGWYLSNSWPKGSHRHPKQPRMLPRLLVVCCLETDDKALLLKTAPPQIIEIQTLRWLLTSAFTPTDQCSCKWKVFYKRPKEKRKHQPTCKLFDLEW